MGWCGAKAVHCLTHVEHCELVDLHFGTGPDRRCVDHDSTMEVQENPAVTFLHVQTAVSGALVFGGVGRWLNIGFLDYFVCSWRSRL